ncbi:trans-aconitate 2-methyltransferase [Isoptericola jiangsuensis]|uniref:Trans-aconitate 2-methyltransferase n=1 Tax=Isoptericola jiangsuensis TaxID=548579 RepID=A0A2A9EXF6_9MICO|nr:methyltransferase domain-containing protein [Isoptericola jiangsuensis]PFG42905.1 trans-aconitate 2-methyltransferase [Isoptericola jiangsuensis]
MADWSPEHYLRYVDERSRPFTELLARVPGDVATVVDLGCGPGHLTGVLRARWPAAHVVGVDSSPAMIERARADDPDGTYLLGDVRDHAAGGVTDDADLVVSNATLQWVPGYRALLPDLADRARVALAFSVPGNHDAPSHVLLRAVAARAPYADVVGPVDRRAVGDPADHLADLARPGWEVDAWETTYTHVLPDTDDGTHPVLRWISATGAQPVLHALDAHDAAHGTTLRARFETELAAELSAAYPRTPHGTPLTFRRVFTVARRNA